MTQADFDKKVTLIRQKAKITLMMTEALTDPKSPTIHSLWKSAGELDAMVTALKEEMAGNLPPKVGG